MLPVRCFTCNTLVGHMWQTYTRERERKSGKECLDELGLRRICCRRMLLTHVPVIDDILMYPNINHQVDDCHTTFSCLVEHERTVSCA